MRRWSLAKPLIHTSPLRSQSRRCYSIVASGPSDVKRISVRCASSGNINVDLHNMAKISSAEPLLVYLPPYSTASGHGVETDLPSFCHGHPTAVIHYRWSGYSPFEDGSDPAPASPESATDNSSSSAPAVEGRRGLARDTPLHWPTPLHDVLQGYSWILRNLAPPGYKRRDIYVCGSYLGASLATSLALTETHPHTRMGLRGCVAFNGIYNWTMFLPDHRINLPPKSRPSNIFEEILGRPQEPGLLHLKQNAAGLFEKPANFFDPFASSCLFFQTPGLHVPRTFDQPIEQDFLPSSSSSSSPLSPWSWSLPLSDFLSTQDLTPEALLASMLPKIPRKSTLVYPPRRSTLKIPQTLLLHTTPPPPPPSLQRRRWRRSKTGLKKSSSNCFKTQADELAAAMRRSVNKIEIKDRLRWDDDYEGWEDEAVRRVQIHDVGLGGRDDPFGLPGTGNRLAEAWLEDRLSR